MSKPCAAIHSKHVSGCRTCWLAIHVKSYQRLWNLPETGEYEAPPKPNQMPTAYTPAHFLPCVNEGEVLEYCKLKGRKAELSHVRACEIHERCTRGVSAIKSCVGCDDYAAPTPEAPEQTGVVIGTYGLPKLARLQIEMIRRTCGEVPILIADDCGGHDAEFQAIANSIPGVSFWPSTERRGHYAGDLSAFHKGLQWAGSNGVRWLCKLSQRFIWTAPGWLAAAVEGLESSGQAILMQDCKDGRTRMCVRTESVVMDVSKWLRHITEFDKPVLNQPTELAIWGLIQSKFAARYAPWNVLPIDRRRPASGTLWHCTHAEPDYRELAKRVGLELDSDFTVSGWSSQPGYKAGVSRISHGGDLGDFFYAIPAIRQMTQGQAMVYLHRQTESRKHRVRNPWTPESVSRLESLLQSQSWCRGVHFSEMPNPQALNMDTWRDRFQHGVNLTDNQTDAFALPRWDHSQPWLEVEPLAVAEVVIHRSPRYHCYGWPWKRVVDQIGHRAVFVGAQDEYECFVREFGHIPYQPTATLMDLARIIAGCKLFIGNQSAPLAIANALCKPVCIELPPSPRNTVFNRPNAFQSAEGGLTFFNEVQHGRHSRNA